MASSKFTSSLRAKPLLQGLDQRFGWTVAIDSSTFGHAAQKQVVDAAKILVIQSPAFEEAVQSYCIDEVLQVIMMLGHRLENVVSVVIVGMIAKPVGLVVQQVIFAIGGVKDKINKTFEKTGQIVKGQIFADSMKGCGISFCARSSGNCLKDVLAILPAKVNSNSGKAAGKTELNVKRVLNGSSTMGG